MGGLLNTHQIISEKWLKLERKENIEMNRSLSKGKVYRIIVQIKKSKKSLYWV